jgi:predicted transposase/invertase (TIGR01784 family)
VPFYALSLLLQAKVVSHNLLCDTPLEIKLLFWSTLSRKHTASAHSARHPYFLKLFLEKLKQDARLHCNIGMKKPYPLDNLSAIINPCYDPVFKCIFTKDMPESKQALRGLVSAILQKDLQVVDVTTNEPPVNGIGDKQIRYDINCVLDDGEKANVEMTLWPKAHEVCRMEYFLARLHTMQEIKGSKNGYRKLKQSYQISLFAKGNVFQDKDFFHRFMYYDPEREIDFGGRTTICTVELKKLEEVVKKPVAEMSRLEKWAVFFGCYCDVNRQELLRKILETEEEISMAENMIARITPKEAAALRQISEDKYWMDKAAMEYEYKRNMRRLKRAKAQIREEGLKEGREEGLEQGREEGREQVKQEVARRMEEQGLSAEQIRAIMGMDNV